MYLTIFHDDQPHSNANVKEQTLGLQLYCELIIESDTLYMLTAVGVWCHLQGETWDLMGWNFIQMNHSIARPLFYFGTLIF